MSTNYYLRTGICECCGRYDELHIGKHSVRWKFAVRIYPDLGINTLDDWKKKWAEPGAVIVNEYEAPITPEEMTETIEANEGRNKSHGYGATRGGLTYDYIDTEFS